MSGEQDPVSVESLPIASIPEVSRNSSVGELRDAVNAYVAVAKAIPTAITSLDKRTVLLRRLFFVFVAALVIDIGFTVFVGYVVATNNTIQTQLSDLSLNNSRLIHNNCDTYGFLLSIYRKDNVPLNSSLTPVGYDNRFIGIQRSADDLNCHIRHVVPGT